MAMKFKLFRKKRRSILHRIILVFLALKFSIILFILALWAMLLNKPNALYSHIHLAITLIILLSVISMVVISIIRKILKPLSLLTESAKKVGKGDLDVVIPVITNDELAELTTTFNQMTADLKKMILARDYLLLDVSHELRTPITRAKIALEMMPDSPEKESLRGDIWEMEIMITDILESERLKNGDNLKILPVRVGDMLVKILEPYQRVSERILLLPVAPELFINIDENMIAYVLRNLIDNSLKYSSSGSPPVEISVIRNKQNISIRIEDFGQGIPEDKLPFVFEPFYRVDSSRSRKTGGYGLGLHLCKRIMDLHGGEIKLVNKPDSHGIIASLIFSVSK